MSYDEANTALIRFENPKNVRKGHEQHAAEMAGQLRVELKKFDKLKSAAKQNEQWPRVESYAVRLANDLT